MSYLLYALFILSCLVLVVAVLLQPGKADAGALFTSSVSSTAFGPRGTQTLLAKITIGAAAAFMLIALALASGVGRQSSVMDDDAAATEQTQPAPATSPAAPAEGAAPPAGEQPAPADANANGNTNTQTNTDAAPATGASPQQQASPGQ